MADIEFRVNDVVWVKLGGGNPTWPACVTAVYEDGMCAVRTYGDGVHMDACEARDLLSWTARKPRKDLNGSGADRVYSPAFKAKYYAAVDEARAAYEAQHCCICKQVPQCA